MILRNETSDPHLGPPDPAAIPHGARRPQPHFAHPTESLPLRVIVLPVSLSLDADALIELSSSSRSSSRRPCQLNAMNYLSSSKIFKDGGRCRVHFPSAHPGPQSGNAHRDVRDPCAHNKVLRMVPTCAATAMANEPVLQKPGNAARQKDHQEVPRHAQHQVVLHCFCVQLFVVVRPHANLHQYNQQHDRARHQHKVDPVPDHHPVAVLVRESQVPGQLERRL
mmetsp:Transcript_8246/g.19878  ORF Transcript_8246/g.19878 Transcript_8246/m.19878 type:complete len:223 (-) Transcript_8246:1815-2483(-)